MCLLLCGFVMSAQSPPPIKIGDVTFSGSIRERGEAWDFFDAGTGGNAYGFSGTTIRFGFSQQKTSYDWNVEFLSPILLGLPEQAVQPAPLGQLGLGGSYYAANDKQQNVGFVNLKQAFIRFKSKQDSLRIGRFDFNDGTEVAPADPTLAALKSDRISQRLIGVFGFSDVLRSFDGVQLSSNRGPWNITALGVIPTRGVFQVDAWGWVKTPFVYGAVTRQANLGRKTKADWRIFGLYYNDDRPIVKTDNRSTALRASDLGGINLGTFGGHFLSATPSESGTYDFLAWGAAQFGTWGQLDHRAAAASIEGGWQPTLWKPARPWFRTGYDWTSGDADAKDGTHGTFFSVLPTPRIYARFPFFNAMNNRDIFGEIVFRPGPAVTTRTDIHSLWLSSSHDLWYSGGGAFQPWTFGYAGRPANGSTSLATLYDTSIDIKATSALNFGFYFGYAVGGDVIKKIFTTNANGALGFMEVTYKF